ncbi:MAG: hypothetical protein OEU26_11935, partial [Candidatus Tectomicrobia bacterium]|nr:hypothetical protein [Candidatus Tectomicrobia bacterium]
QQGETIEATQDLAQLAEREDGPPQGKIVIPKLQAILDGNRDPALAAAPSLYYVHAVERQLLLENLTAS